MALFEIKIPDNIHVHIHDHRVGDVEKLSRKIDFLTQKANQIMSTQTEAAELLNATVAKLDAVAVEVDKIGTETDGLQKEIQDLKDAAGSQGNITPELQAAIDAIAARGESLAAKVAAVDAKVPDATPPEEPTA